VICEFPLERDLLEGHVHVQASKFPSPLALSGWGSVHSTEISTLNTGHNIGIFCMAHPYKRYLNVHMNNIPIFRICFTFEGTFKYTICKRSSFHVLYSTRRKVCRISPLARPQDEGPLPSIAFFPAFIQRPPRSPLECET
jgi:hypothetical protein